MMMTLQDREQPRLLLACYFPRSIHLEGVGTFVAGVAAGLAAEGWAVELLIPGDSLPQRPGITIRSYRPGLFGLGRYLAAIKRYSVHAHAVLLVENNPNVALVASASRSPGRTWCYFYTPLQQLRTWASSRLSRQSLLHRIAKNVLWARLQPWRSRRCIVPTQFQADQLRPFGPAELHVLPGSSISRATAVPDRQASRKILGWDDSPVIGYLGHYSHAKGVDLLIEAFSRYDGPGRLALAYSGKGRLSSPASERLERLRGAGRVVRLGVTDVLTFLAACDAVALPYRTSSIHHLPQVMLESFAASTAVITTAVGGLGEAHCCGVTGLLLDPGQPLQLRDAIAQVAADRPRWHAMGRTARTLFETQLCSEEFCRRLSQLLRDPAAGWPACLAIRLPRPMASP